VQGRAGFRLRRCPFRKVRGAEPSAASTEAVRVAAGLVERPPREWVGASAPGSYAAGGGTTRLPTARHLRGSLANAENGRSAATVHPRNERQGFAPAMTAARAKEPLSDGLRVPPDRFPRAGAPSLPQGPGRGGIVRMCHLGAGCQYFESRKARKTLARRRSRSAKDSPPRQILVAVASNVRRSVGNQQALVYATRSLRRVVSVFPIRKVE